MSNGHPPERAALMSSMPLKSMPQPDFAADLLSRAASLLDAEVVRLQPARPLSRPAPIGSGELLNGGEASAPMDLLSRVLEGAHADDLRRRASDFLETLVASLTQGKAPSASSDDDRVPLLRSVAPVRAGSAGSVSLCVCNEEASPAEVSLYASNFVAESGYEMPSLLASFAPRRAVLAAGAEATFEIKLAVPAQAPPGLYSGLVQAAGSKYVKAVVMFEVL